VWRGRPRPCDHREDTSYRKRVDPSLGKIGSFGGSSQPSRAAAPAHTISGCRWRSRGSRLRLLVGRRGIRGEISSWAEPREL
jgi:hypothetical protein